MPRPLRLLLLAAALLALQGLRGAVPLLPAPKCVVEGAARPVRPFRAVLADDDAAFRAVLDEIEALADPTAAATLVLRIDRSAKAAHAFRRAYAPEAPRDALEREFYGLCFAGDTIRIVAPTEAGGRHALQTLKQLLMVSGMDRYFQIVKCFRDEDLRADRQPEFTQIDCEMSFVNQDDVIGLFEGMAKHLFRELRGVELDEPFTRMPWADAMKYYGSDKPDLRFDMKFVELMDVMKGYGFPVFDSAAYIGGICAKGAATYTRKQLDQLTDFVKRPQIGAKGMVYARVEADGTVKSSVDKFYTQETLQKMKEAFNAEPGDLILILSGDDAMKTRKQLCELRLEMGNRLGLRDKNKFACLWVVDFPMFEWSEEEQRLMAMHHPFTHPKDEDIPLLDTDPAAVRADAYDMVVNGVEVGGGSIRIHDSELQAKMFEILGFTPEKAQEQFGFLMNAFKFGAPPHGGLAYGLDRWVSLFAGLDSIRDCIAFPKNNSGRDVMLEAPAPLDQKQLDELSLSLAEKE